MVAITDDAVDVVVIERAPSIVAADLVGPVQDVSPAAVQFKFKFNLKFVYFG